MEKLCPVCPDRQPVPLIKGEMLAMRTSAFFHDKPYQLCKVVKLSKKSVTVEFSGYYHTYVRCFTCSKMPRKKAAKGSNGTGSLFKTEDNFEEWKEVSTPYKKAKWDKS
jgi:hypothetical protein